jgi:hypothetical protein
VSQLWAQAPLDSGPIRHVAAGSFVFVVKGDGSVVGWGGEADGLAAHFPICPPMLSMTAGNGDPWSVPVQFPERRSKAAELRVTSGGRRITCR